MKRYNLVNWLDGQVGVIEDIEGEFVRYSDIAIILEDMGRVRKLVNLLIQLRKE